MFGRKKREYAQQVVANMHNICPIADKQTFDSFKVAFTDHFEPFRKSDQPAQAPAVFIPLHFCEHLHDLTHMCKFEETKLFDPWKEWLVTITDVLLNDEPYASSTQEMGSKDYREKFERLKTYYTRPEIGAGDSPDTYGDLVERGRMRMEVLQRGLAKLEEAESKLKE